MDIPKQIRASWTDEISSVRFCKMSFGYELHLWMDHRWPEVNHSYCLAGKDSYYGFEFNWYDDDLKEVINHQSICIYADLSKYLNFWNVEKDTFHSIWIPFSSFQFDGAPVEQIALERIEYDNKED